MDEGTWSSFSPFECEAGKLVLEIVNAKFLSFLMVDILIEYPIWPDCGMPNRIIKSEIPESEGKLDPADLSFPWNALLYVRNESGLSTVHRVLCAATLIGKSTVLTTADCLIIQDKNSSVMTENVIIVLNPSSEIFSENLLDPMSNVYNVSDKYVNQNQV